MSASGIEGEGRERRGGKHALTEAACGEEGRERRTTEMLQSGGGGGGGGR